MALFQRSKAGDYREKPGGLAGVFRMDSIIVRILLYVAMSAAFFFFLKITERKIPHGLAPDSTEDTVHITRPAK